VTFGRSRRGNNGTARRSLTFAEPFATQTDSAFNHAI
jgi:hypothetical protein